MSGQPRVGSLDARPTNHPPTATSRPTPTLESVLIDDCCTACGACLVTCPTRALRRAPKRPTVVDAACIGCGECVEICPAGAITEVLR